MQDLFSQPTWKTAKYGYSEPWKQNYTLWIMELILKSLQKRCQSFSLYSCKADHASMAWRRFKACFSRQTEVEVSGWKGTVVCVALHTLQQSPSTGKFCETFSFRTHQKNQKASSTCSQETTKKDCSLQVLSDRYHSLRPKNLFSKKIQHFHP